MANNLWSNYTEKTATPVDADEVMVRDSTDGKNKRLLFGTFWKWVAKKLNEATISELETDNKTIIGAINALNGKKINGYHNSGSQLTIPNVKKSSIIYISGSGNNNYYIGFIDINEDISRIVSNNIYDSYITYDKSSKTLSLPQNGYYLYCIDIS